MLAFFNLSPILANATASSFLEVIKSIFMNFHISDAIDIIVLALIFGFSVKFFKSRKAGALIIGIVICLVIYILALIFDLSGLKFLLSGVFQIGALALVIIFQPELRELLERLGTGSLKGIANFGDKGHKNSAQYKAIESICNAVQIFSVEKTGALIVIERTTQLDDIINTGTVLNAEISDSLLRNIFVNRAPLHDGAVVINDGKIAAAACILPLPRRVYVDADLGTRHRAAIGLSEISDALVVVVSEETGIISVAKECELLRNFTPDALRKFLRKEILKDSMREDEN
jgi:diadenylate cyclase